MVDAMFRIPVADFLETVGLEFSGNPAGEIRVKVCPFCKGMNDLVINGQTALYDCHKCGERGNAVTLAKHFERLDLLAADSSDRRIQKPSTRLQVLSTAMPGKPAVRELPKPLPDVEACHAVLLQDEEAASYVMDRGLQERAIRHFKLGLLIRHGEPWLVIPHYHGGELVNAKFRKLREKAWQRVKGRPSVLFNSDVIQENPPEIILVEAELDAISLWQMGFPNTVALTCGAGVLEPNWFDDLRAYMDAGGRLIFICDNDFGRPDGKNPGQEGAYDIAQRLGLDEILNYVLPGGAKDANEYMVARMAEGRDCESIGCILREDIAKKAKPFPIHNTLEIGDAVARILELGGRKIEVKPELVVDWDSPDLNRLHQNEAHDKGFIPQATLTFVMAPPKTGKTTLAQQLCLHNAKKGIPVFDYCVEMRPQAKALLYMQQFAGHPMPYSAEEMARIRARFSSMPLIIGYNEIGATPVIVLKTMEHVRARHGCKLIVFDNLQFLFRGKDEYSRISEFTIQLKETASRLHVAMVVIVQPNIKSLRGGDMPDYTQIKTASDAAADCDFFVILHREMLREGEDGDAIFAREGKIKVISRESRGGICPVIFDETARLFYPVGGR